MDDKNSFTDASCPTSNATFMHKQRNGGKRNPTTPDMNEENPSGHQRQKKPHCGVKVDTAHVLIGQVAGLHSISNMDQGLNPAAILYPLTTLVFT